MSLDKNKRIAKNTLFLYIRMLVTMAISLYTSRIVLNTLGVEDYGIYHVVGGVVAMFSTVNSTMTTAVQRFMNFQMGQGDNEKLNRIFNTSLYIHFGLALLVFAVVELIGVWFLNTHMNIAPERMNAANWVLQFSILTLMVRIISVPYNAAIIANERMKVFAYISILEVTLKLLVVFMLVWFSFDKLKLYAVLMFLVAVLIRIIYGTYSKKNFDECDFRWKWDRSIFKEMTSFAGWNMIGVSSTMIRTQGLNVVLNLFFGVVLNAAMGIADQVKNAIESFVNNFMTAIKPQIVKSYSRGDFTYLMQLVFQGSRYAFYLLLFLTLPILIETDYVLKLWLKTVPDYTVIFVRLIIIISLIDSLSKTLIQTMFATGKIRNYQLVVGSVTLLNLPIAIFFLYLGYPPQVVFIVGIGLSVISLIVRLTMLKKMVNLQVLSYLKHVVVNVLYVGVLAIILPVSLLFILDTSFLRFFLVGLISVIAIGSVIYFVGLSVNERIFVNRKLKNILKINNSNF